MKKLKIYLDTSVISYLKQNPDLEKMNTTLKLWDKIKTGDYEVVISDVAIAELSQCEENKRNYLWSMLGQIDYSLMRETPETVALAHRFIEQNVLTKKSLNDCRHIACAVVAGCDIITSWNFKHMVNVRTVNGVKIINMMEGYRTVEIYPPTMLIEGEEDEEE
jgi:predicted nucleic acid-binding protein